MEQHNATKPKKGFGLPEAAIGTGVTATTAAIGGHILSSKNLTNALKDDTIRQNVLNKLTDLKATTNGFNPERLTNLQFSENGHNFAPGLNESVSRIKDMVIPAMNDKAEKIASVASTARYDTKLIPEEATSFIEKGKLHNVSSQFVDKAKALQDKIGGLEKLSGGQKGALAIGALTLGTLAVIGVNKLRNSPDTKVDTQNIEHNHMNSQEVSQGASR